MNRRILTVLIAIVLTAFSSVSTASETMRVGSKRFPESYILGEIVTQLAASVGEASVSHDEGLGSTGIVAAALESGAIDIYAEYTGTIRREILRQGPLSALSCVGVGSGSMRWSEEELQRLEIGVVGAFGRGCHGAGIAQFCLLSAVGSTARSRFRYVRVMGMKEDTVRSIGFTRLAIFRPGIIVGNAHTPVWAGWLGSLVPGPYGIIHQRILGRSITAEIALHSREAGEVTRENAAMKKLAAECAQASRTDQVEASHRTRQRLRK